MTQSAQILAAAHGGKPVAGAACCQPPGGPAHPGRAVLIMIDHHALAAGFSRRFLVAAGIILLAFIIAIAAVPGCRADLAGSTTQRQPSRTDDTRLPAIGP